MFFSLYTDPSCHYIFSMLLTSQAAAVTSEGVSGEKAGLRAALTCNINTT